PQAQEFAQRAWWTQALIPLDCLRGPQTEALAPAGYLSGGSPQIQFRGIRQPRCQPSTSRPHDRLLVRYRACSESEAQRQLTNRQPPTRFERIVRPATQQGIYPPFRAISRSRWRWRDPLTG